MLTNLCYVCVYIYCTFLVKKDEYTSKRQPTAVEEMRK